MPIAIDEISTTLEEREKRLIINDVNDHEI